MKHENLDIKLYCVQMIIVIFCGYYYTNKCKLPYRSVISNTNKCSTIEAAIYDVYILNKKK